MGPEPSRSDRVGVTDLVRRAQQGDRDAFQALYREHVGRVYALCLRLSADAVRAEELTQDAFVRAWERLASFRGESAFSSWMYRLTVNVVLQERRAARRRSVRVVTTDDLAAVERGEQGEHGGQGGAGGAAPPGLSPDPELAVAARPPGARAGFV